MTVFKAFHPQNETLGSAVLAIIAAIDYRDISSILQQYGLRDIQPDGWYSQQTELDIMKAIMGKGGMMDMVSIGMKIPDVVEYPMQIKTVKEALTMLDAGYQHSHRGENIGHFKFEETSENSLRMEAHTPYPSDFDYGLFYRLVQKFRPLPGRPIKVVHLDTPNNRKKGGDTCYFDISW
ncbi:MAG: hypothetical protein ACOYL5_18780 [Phototrophicaceae bacterium]